MRKTMRVAIAVLVVAGLVAGGVRAFNPQPEPPLWFGMVGLAQTQSAVLNVVLTTPPDPNTPPDPMRAGCRLGLSFMDAQGRPFHDAAGNEVKKVVELRGNVADSLRLRAGDAIPTGQLRAPIRALVSFPPDRAEPPECRGLVATLEIVSPLGFTQLLYVGQATPDDGTPDPNDGSTP
jgi:hypothetical protein